MKITTNFIKQTKRHLSASGSILLPLALKWGLVGLVDMVMLSAFGTQSVSAASITLTVPKEPLTFNITPSGGGTFGKSTAGTIEIQTDALAGYTLNIKAKDGNANLANAATGDKISPISGNVSENDFTSKAIYNNMWGFSFNKQGASSNVFHSIPGDAVGAKIGSTEVPNTAEDIYNIVLGARVDNSLATGAYSNTFIVVASANPVPYKVKYDPNAGSDSVSGMPSNDVQGSKTTDTQTFILPAQEPTRVGYEFIGWCKHDPQDETGVDVCQNSIAYQPSDTYTLSDKNEDIIFYAMWAKESNIMQNWKGCASAKTNEQITLVDIRDNRPYYVAKLADGNCWMTENLDLFIDKNTTYTVADTDLDHATEEEKAACKEKEPSCVDEGGNYQWKPTESTHETGDMTEDAVLPLYSTYSYDPGDICWRGERTWNTPDKTPNVHFSDDTKACGSHDESHYHLGNYYALAAAVANSDTAKHNKLNYTYGTSICPLGWQLPNVGGDKSYDGLRSAIIDDGNPDLFWVTGGIGAEKDGQDTEYVDTIHAMPYYFVYSGFKTAFSFMQFGYEAHYLANTAYSETKFYALYFHATNNIITTKYTNVNDRNAFTVRCVSRYGEND